MRYIDELLALYPGKDPFTRKFVLAQILDQPPDAYSDEIVEFLWQETRAQESVVRRQARHTIGQYLPPHAGHGYRFVADAAGIWTNAFKMDEETAAPAAPQDTAAGRQLAAGAAAGLTGSIRGLLELMERGSAVERAAASLVLGRLHTPDVVRALAAAVDAPEPSYMAAFSLAETGEEEGVEALVRAVGLHAKTRPDLCALLRSLPCPASLAALDAAESVTDAAGRANVALALAPYDAGESRPLLERLIRRKEGWVSAYALDTLSGHGDPADVPLLALGWQLETHEFIRVQAVRAAGTIRSDAAREFLLGVLGGAPGRVQSVALEALAAQDIPAEELAKLARGYLASDFVRTRVQAMLLVSRHDPDEIQDALSALVLDSKPLLRLEGAFITGYLRGPGTVALLEGMATSDPSAAVRLQAIKSLGRYPSNEALPVLTKLLAHPSRPILMTACRAIASLNDRPSAVVVALAEAVKKLTGAPARAAVLRALGAAARAADRPPPQPLVDALDDQDPLIKVGALEGLKYLGDEIPADRVLALAGHADPRVRARAALVAFLAGKAPDAAALEPMLASQEEAQTIEALGALLEIGLVAPYLGRGGFGRLAAQLRAQGKAAEKQAGEFAVLPAGADMTSALPAAARETAALPSGAPSAAPAAAPSTAAAPAKQRPPPARATRPVPSLRKPALLASLSGNAPSPAKFSTKDLANLAGKYSASSKDLAGESSEAIVIPMGSGVFPRAMGTTNMGSRGVSRVESSSPAMRAPSTKQKVPATEAERFPPPLKAAAGVAAALALFVLGAMLFRPGPAPIVGPGDPIGSPAPGQIPATAARVWSAKGRSTRTGRDGQAQQLGAGVWLKSGDRVATDPGARLELRLKDGSSAVLGGSAGVSFGDPSPKPGAPPPVHALFDDPTGELTLESKGTEVHLRLGGSTLKLKAGQTRILGKSDGWQVDQVEGDGTLQKGPSDRQVLVAGQGSAVAR